MTGLLVALLLAAPDAPQGERALEEYWAPHYPQSALARRVEGQFTCQLSVDEMGTVRAAAIEDAGDAELSAAVTEAVSRLRFSRAAGTTAVTFVYRFTLSPEFSVVPGLLALNGAVRVQLREAGTRLPGQCDNVSRVASVAAPSTITFGTPSSSA